MILDVNGVNYEDKLKDAGLTTLEKRRERGIVGARRARGGK